MSHRGLSIRIIGTPSPGAGLKEIRMSTPPPRVDVDTYIKSIIHHATSREHTLRQLGLTRGCFNAKFLFCPQHTDMMTYLVRMEKDEEKLLDGLTLHAPTMHPKTHPYLRMTNRHDILEVGVQEISLGLYPQRKCFLENYVTRWLNELQSTYNQCLCIIVPESRLENKDELTKLLNSPRALLECFLYQMEGTSWNNETTLRRLLPWKNENCMVSVVSLRHALVGSVIDFYLTDVHGKTYGLSEVKDFQMGDVRVYVTREFEISDIRHFRAEKLYHQVRERLLSTYGYTRQHVSRLENICNAGEEEIPHYLDHESVFVKLLAGEFEQLRWKIVLLPGDAEEDSIGAIEENYMIFLHEGRNHQHGVWVFDCPKDFHSRVFQQSVKLECGLILQDIIPIVPERGIYACLGGINQTAAPQQTPILS